MLSDRKHRWRYEDIMDRVYRESDGEHRLSIGALSRYYNNVLLAELDEAERRTEFSMRLAAAVTEAAQAEDAEAMEAVILSVIDGAFLANETDPSAMSPVALLQAKAALLRVQNQREKLRLRERELGAQLEKVELEKEKAERELDREKAEREAKDSAARAAIGDVEKLSKTERDRLIVNTMKNALEITA